ncbi:hypothetical protein F889_02165 [Acinetobacter colistiniresistens]|uniref:Uncharacterized protein n=1 Tax=Acinetobacter colistiniresistens TaxID=280145 RepID=N9PIZ3_9GAMM|nr:hypothetical protein F889_02165 [Acinetobacter colistiniresistens]
MSSISNKELRLGATLTVFTVLMIQTVLLKMNFDLRPESTKILLTGFIASDILAVCTWLFFTKAE